MKGLRVHENKSTGKLKVVNGYFDTICEYMPDEKYAKNHKVTINEMAFASSLRQCPENTMLY